MLPAASTRPLWRVMPVLTVALLYGCSDPSTPLGPRIDARPHALVAPIVTVTNTDDFGAGSLRQAILDAPAGAVIQFDAAVAGKTITLTSGKLDVDKDLTIDGPLAGLTISGGLTDRVFWIYEDINAVLRNLTIVNGRGTFGGGIMDIGHLTLDHVLLANNEGSESGGGIYVPPNSQAELILVNSTVSGNRGRRGGGIASYGLVISRNSTIAQNVAEQAGGIYVGEGIVSLRNSIIAINADSDPTAELTPNCDIAAGVTVFFAGRNLSSDESCGTDPTMLIESSVLNPLANNGGPTMTHALRLSNAVDAGLSCTENTDQRYVLRNQGTSCDLGAYEFNTYGTLTITINPSASVTKAGVANVTGTITCTSLTATALDVGMSQTQKAKGKFTTIVQAQAAVAIPVCGPSPSSWSATLTPATGLFEAGAATGTSNAIVPGFLPAAATSTLKIFQVK